MKLATSSSVKPLYGGKNYGKRRDGIGHDHEERARGGKGSLSCPINKTPLPPYLTLYTRKILLNLVLDEYPRREKRQKKREREEKMQRGVADPPPVS